MKTSKINATPGTHCARYLCAIIAILFLTLIANPTNAQQKWRLEIRHSIDFPTVDLVDANLDAGVGLESTIAYNIAPHLAVYAGWSWNRFTSEKSFMGTDADFDETGYSFGLQFIHPIKNATIQYMLKGGAIYNHIETENSAGKIINDTGHGWGWQIGGGIAIPLGKRLLLIPEMRYRSLTRDFVVGEVRTAADLRYIAVGAGLSWSF